MRSYSLVTDLKLSPPAEKESLNLTLNNTDAILGLSRKTVPDFNNTLPIVRSHSAKPKKEK